MSKFRSAADRLLAGVISCRYLPIMAFAMVRWRVLAANMGMGRWVTRKRGNRSKRVSRGTPWTSRWHPTRTGFQFRVWLRRGDSMPDLTARIEDLSIGLRGTVRLSPVPGKPWRVTVSVQRLDPFSKRVAPSQALSPTRIKVGVTELGQPFVMDFRLNPHALLSGATGSGKSGGIAALLYALSSTDAILALIDLKHGISAAPMKPRASVIAETRTDAAQLLADVLTIGKVRAGVVKAAGVENVYDLPPDQQMPEVWVFCDEVAELSSGPKGPEKDAGAEASASLLSCAQLLRALGVHIVVSAQRFAASQGPQVTNIRAQLGGRVCFRANDMETANMAIGDVSPNAAIAALAIELPGCAISNTGKDRWEVVRFSKVAHADLGPVALANADKRADWHQVMAGTVAPVVSITPQDETQAVWSGEPAA